MSKRTEVCAVRLTPKEKESVERTAQFFDRSVTAYFRWLHAEHLKAIDSGTASEYETEIESLLGE